jgi:leucyl/phenylalanyl-tRNA--protein transferase
LIRWLQAGDTSFPPTANALPEPNGLLAAGGDLSPERLLVAYGAGIFPWFEEGQPILWWAPDPRAILLPEEVRVSRSLGKTMRNGRLEVSVNQAFPQVIEACAAPRGEAGTWITASMAAAYARLNELGHAHSVEIWRDGALVGGLYGVAIGRVFFGESMFSRSRDASKVALVWLARQTGPCGPRLIDCQLPSSHLESMGSRMISRSKFESLLAEYCSQEPAACIGPRPRRPLSWHDTPVESG